MTRRGRVAHAALGAMAGAAAALGAGCSAGAPDPASGAAEGLFADATERWGLAGVEHFAGFTAERYLPETMGGGVGVLDYDGDGWLDLYLVNSAPPAGAASSAPTNRMFQGADGSFRETTVETGTGDPSFGMGCAVGDADGDGDPDLYVTNWGPNVLYVNGGGRFADRSREGGVDDGRWSVSAGFFDAERDGDLDLYVVNYLVFQPELQRAAYARAGRALGAAYPHPDRFDAVHDRLYVNDGAALFSDGTRAAGVEDVLPGKGLGVAFADVDLDGDTDVYVANDSTPNFLFLNDGRGRFRDVAAEAGCAYNLDGDSEASMGVDFGDADGDGLPELFTTHLDIETNTFYDNTSGPELLEFRDRTRAAALGTVSFRLTGFGTAFFDFDSDGHLDLFVANGDIHPNAAQLRPGHTYAQPDQLLRGNGGGRFELVGSEAAGPHFGRRLVGRGAALGDLDRDGDTDLVVASSGGPLVLLENRATGPRHWLRLRLAGGPGDPRDGQGARVTVTAGGRRQVRELWTAKSYASASEAAVHFGLGQAAAAEGVEVRWPSGLVERWEGLEADRVYELRSGEPEPVVVPGRRF